MNQDNVELADYIHDSPIRYHHSLEVLREVIEDAYPEVEESVHGKIAMFYHHSGILACFAFRDKCINLYFKPEVVKEYQAALEGLDIERGCIHFSRVEELPLPIIKEMIRKSS